jgi:hypothetical protein
MYKNKTARIVAFVGALGASAALIASAVGTTGAYFTDSKTGNIGASFGKVAVNRVGSFDASFNNLRPGEYQTKTITYNTNTGTGDQDIWLVFDPNNTAYQAINTVGGFAHFAVSNSAGDNLFSGWNLKLQNGTSPCADADGHANQPERVDSCTYGVNDPLNTLCGIPQAIKLQSNVPANSERHFAMTFGNTPRATAPWASFSIPFKVVATQPGIRPDNPLNPAGSAS